MQVPEVRTSGPPVYSHPPCLFAFCRVHFPPYQHSFLGGLSTQAVPSNYMGLPDSVLGCLSLTPPQMLLRHPPPSQLFRCLCRGIEKKWGYRASNCTCNFQTARPSKSTPLHTTCIWTASQFFSSSGGPRIVCIHVTVH